MFVDTKVNGTNVLKKQKSDKKDTTQISSNASDENNQTEIQYYNSKIPMNSLSSWKIFLISIKHVCAYSNCDYQKLQKLPTSLQTLLDEDHRAVKKLRTDETAEAKVIVIDTKKTMMN